MKRSHKKIKSKLKKIIKDYEEIFVINENFNVFCLHCKDVIKCKSRFKLKQHINTKKHEKNAFNNICDDKQGVILYDQKKTKKSIAEILCKGMLRSDIPLHKLKNNDFNKMLFELTGTTVSETFVRSQIEYLYNNEQEKLINLIKNEPFYLIFDESPIKTYKFWNVLIGLIKNPGKEYLLGSFYTIKTSNKNMVHEVIDTLIKKYKLSYQNLYLLITDAVKYNIAFYNDLHEKYPHIMHFTCISHLLHNCVTYIMKKFHDVDQLIKKINILLGYNKSLCLSFRSLGPFQKPCETRWGKCIDFLIFLKKFFDQIRTILNDFKNVKSETYKECMVLINKKTIFNDISYIVKNYGFFSKIIIYTEKNDFSILESINLIKKLRFNDDKIDLTSYIQKRIKKHFLNAYILDDNLINENQNNVLSLPATGAAVERSFSMLKDMLRDNRNFNVENIEKFFFIKYNKF
ncbi:hypothetical protein EHP00_1087 [Ecytonucleospora hepatopenaei]|uniref:DUF659 domain-containing protein n=1 Tax=Ecytonucleospora hepatopenaei TaxID=646526 RepID=A0A1W0E592_9MICR|nr:hypothetical protein EHP00_1087 [Ecytonucleospora hepatopenaei]